MAWSFCPWCAHRIYQHNDAGCTHLVEVLKECADPECKPDVIVTEGGGHAHTGYEKCDCKRPYSLLLEGSITG
jgi:hypothetical protein